MVGFVVTGDRDTFAHTAEVIAVLRARLDLSA